MGLWKHGVEQILAVAGMQNQETERKTLARQISTKVSNGRGIWKGDARIGAGLEGTFFSFEETSYVVLYLRCQRGMEGRLHSEPMGG